MIRSARFLPVLVMGLLSVFATPIAMAQSTIQVDCNDRFADDLKWKLADLDKPVFGVRARDWSAETVRDWQRKALACVNGKENWSEEAMKAPMRQRINAAASNPEDIFAVRDDNLRKEGRQSAANNQNLSQVTMNNGMPQEIRIDDEPRTCTSISKGIGLTSEENYRQAIAFARMCQQVGYTKADTVSMLEAAAARVAPVRKMLEDFASRTDALARQPQPSPDAVQALNKQHDALYEQFKTAGLMTHPAFPPDSKRLKEAESKLDAMWKQVEEKTCRENVVKSGFPAAWKENYILMELNSPELFCTYVKAAQRNGATIRYLSSGLFSKEGFEVKSPKRTVQVFLQSDRLPGGDPNIKLMVPVSAKIDGKSIQVTTGNLRAVAAELFAAMNNQ